MLWGLKGLWRSAKAKPWKSARHLTALTCAKLGYIHDELKIAYPILLTESICIEITRKAISSLFCRTSCEAYAKQIADGYIRVFIEKESVANDDLANVYVQICSTGLTGDQQPKSLMYNKYPRSGVSTYTKTRALLAT